MLFHSRLEELRNKRGLSKSELARRSKISYNQVIRIIDGSAQPTLQAIEKLAKALNISTRELFEEDSIEEIEERIDWIMKDYKTRISDNLKRDVLNFLENLVTVSDIKKSIS